jgi:hypothetical protein
MTNSELKIKLDRAREASEAVGMRIVKDNDLREFAKGDMNVYASIRFEEMHILLKESGLLTEDEYRSGPNHSTLSAAAERIRASRRAN